MPTFTLYFNCFAFLRPSRGYKLHIFHFVNAWGGQCLMNDSSSDMATLVMYLAKLTVWSSGRRMHSHVYNCWCYLLGFLLFRLTTTQITPCRPCAESLQSSFFTLVLSILKLFCLSIAFLVGHCFFSFRIAFGLQYQLNDFVLTF